MTFTDIRAALKRKPFIPFTLYFADGSTAYIRGADFLLLPPVGSTVIVYELVIEGLHLVPSGYRRTDADVLQITRLLYDKEPADQFTGSEQSL
jgi:lysophospholipase L1-like esterase